MPLIGGTRVPTISLRALTIWISCLHGLLNLTRSISIVSAASRTQDVYKSYDVSVKSGSSAYGYTDGNKWSAVYEKVLGTNGTTLTPLWYSADEGLTEAQDAKTPEAKRRSFRLFGRNDGPSDDWKGGAAPSAENREDADSEDSSVVSEDDLRNAVLSLSDDAFRLFKCSI